MENANIIEFIESSKFYELSTSYRWQGIRMIKVENTAEHSYYVALFSLFIAESLALPKSTKNKAIQYALLHDYDEVFTGDIRHSLKYQTSVGEDIRYSIKKYVGEVMDGLSDKSFYNRVLKETIESESDYMVKSIVKIADWLSMYFIMKNEIEMGNISVTKHFEYCKSQLLELSSNLENNIGINKLSTEINNYFNK